MTLPEYLVTPMYTDNVATSKASVPIGNSGTAAYSSDSAINVKSSISLV